MKKLNDLLSLMMNFIPIYLLVWKKLELEKKDYVLRKKLLTIATIIYYFFLLHSDWTSLISLFPIYLDSYSLRTLIFLVWASYQIIFFRLIMSRALLFMVWWLRLLEEQFRISFTFFHSWEFIIFRRLSFFKLNPYLPYCFFFHVFKEWD